MEGEEWTDVKDALPAPGDLYWVMDWNRISIAWWDECAWSSWDDKDDIIYPTHWAKMTPPPFPYPPAGQIAALQSEVARLRAQNEVLWEERARVQAALEAGGPGEAGERVGEALGALWGRMEARLGKGWSDAFPPNASSPAVPDR